MHVAAEDAILDIVELATRIQKGTPLPADEAVTGANPYYAEAFEYQVNCQRCVQAYELRRRGYDVIAKPKPKVNDVINWGSECFIPPGQSAYSAFTMRQTEAAIKRELTAAPDGARYTIYIKWKGRNNGAHVFIAEKVNGKVHYFDPQTGEMDVSGYFNMGSRGHFGYFRMDDRKLTERIDVISATVEVK